MVGNPSIPTPTSRSPWLRPARRVGVDCTPPAEIPHDRRREAGLLDQVAAPALRSRNPERRQAGLEDLRALAVLAQELTQPLFWRALRKIAAG